MESFMIIILVPAIFIFIADGIISEDASNPLIFLFNILMFLFCAGLLFVYFAYVFANVIF